LAKPYFEKEFIIYTDATEKEVYAILILCDDEFNENPVAYMNQSLSYYEFKYSYIEKHVFALVKDVENFCHFILGNHTLVKFPLPIVKFFLHKLIFQGRFHIVLPRYRSMI
jgi:hypothetical protein